MEFRIDRSALTDAVAWAARVLPTRSPVPVLGGLLLEADSGWLRISGLDYEASACIEVEAETVRAGRVLVMGRRLLDVCRVLPESPVVCAVEGSRFSVTGGGARFGLSVLPLDDYPALPPLPGVLGAVDSEEFAAAVAHVAVAAGRDDTLPTLTGIRVGLDGDTMTLAATDRYRFAVRTLAWKPATADASADVVVSARRLTEIARSFGRSGMVSVALDAGSAGFELAGMRTTVRLLDGRLPRHDKLFAMTDPTTAMTDRAPLVEAVKRVAVVADGDSPLQLTFSGESVLLQAGYEDDVASQRLPAVLEGADELTVAFNPSYLMDALASFDAPVVQFSLMGPGQRAMITGRTAGGSTAESDQSPAPRPTHRHLLMSVKPLV
ncbi:DNA polymerase III subunit beta [Streptomyces sp. NBC_01762]|uniref:DNA polymerase III subunit beta n=1 Tax=unclassified Streptomyces TaxID=2593676 RepID=UPI002DDC2869|nr:MULTISPECIES: DNA polymerase III subunit beta [unclassified Streptomyces]WSC46418.1 DNA polymerase III subunit beta [Streptomyces sp. NBC_01762]WSD26071.1 DNA polymerase III subunit beta [Streptomyces sp. NBC_01751]WSJ51980.1 DNA polymerase III subunit beta [Streptomyces sp. NBC_01318]